MFLLYRSSRYDDFLNQDPDLDMFDHSKQSPHDDPDVILRGDPSYIDPPYRVAQSNGHGRVWHTTIPHSTPTILVHNSEEDSGIGGLDELERRVRNPLYEVDTRPAKDVFKLSSQVIGTSVLDELELQDYQTKMPKKAVWNGGGQVHGSLHLPPEGSFSLSDIMYSTR